MAANVPGAGHMGTTPPGDPWAAAGRGGWPGQQRDAYRCGVSTGGQERLFGSGGGPPAISLATRVAKLGTAEVLEAGSAVAIVPVPVDIGPPGPRHAHVEQREVGAVFASPSDPGCCSTGTVRPCSCPLSQARSLASDPSRPPGPTPGCCWPPKPLAWPGWSSSPAPRSSGSPKASAFPITSRWMMRIRAGRRAPTACPSAWPRTCAQASPPGSGSPACHCARCGSGILASISGSRCGGVTTRHTTAAQRPLTTLKTVAPQASSGPQPSPDPANPHSHRTQRHPGGRGQNVRPKREHGSRSNVMR